MNNAVCFGIASIQQKFELFMYDVLTQKSFSIITLEFSAKQCTMCLHITSNNYAK